MTGIGITSFTCNQDQILKNFESSFDSAKFQEFINATDMSDLFENQSKMMELLREKNKLTEELIKL